MSGLDKVEVRDYMKKAQTPFQFLEQEAHLGNSEAQIDLSLVYMCPDWASEYNRFTLNYAKGVEWLEKAAELRNPHALVNLADLYCIGEIVQQDFKKAHGYFLRLANLEENNHTGYAQYHLAQMCLLGLGCDQDLMQAAIWSDKASSSRYEHRADGHYDLSEGVSAASVEEFSSKALDSFIQTSSLHEDFNQAEAGDVEKQIALANSYEAGYLVDVDLKKSRYWLKKAANAGSTKAMMKLFFSYYDEGSSLSRKKAFKWINMAAEAGDTEALYNLGCCYENGFGVRHCMIKAESYYRKGTELQDINCMTSLARMYFEGYCFDHSIEDVKKEAEGLYLAASEKGCSLAQCNLARMYCEGYGVEVNYEAARRLFTLAAIQGDFHAKEMLAIMCFYGLGGPVDFKHAQFWFESAPSNIATTHLGRLHELGLTGEIDVFTAKSFYIHSAVNDCPIAKMFLGFFYAKGEHYDQAEACYWLELAMLHNVSDYPLSELATAYMGRAKDILNDLAA